MWDTTHVQFLINERKRRNHEYHSMRKKQPFWDNVAAKLNRQFNTVYTGKQCYNKFLQLIRDFNKVVQVHIMGESILMNSRHVFGF
ncbi:12157_t:CDS:2, partial [Dentiscutata heterogama]